MKTSKLKLFSDAHVLRQVGRPLLGEFFERFMHLLPSKYSLPNPRPDNEAYFDSLAGVLERTSELPDGLAQALLEVEAFGTAVENGEAPPLSQAIQRWLDVHSDRNGSSPLVPAACVHPVSDIQHPESPSSEALPTAAPPTEALPTAAPVSAAPPTDTPSGSDPDQQAFERLARMSSALYDRARRAEARRLHLRIQTLDAEVTKRRSELAIEAQANAVKLPAIEPWPDSVNGSEVLDQVSARFSLYLVLPGGAADASALWIGHSHAFAAFHLTPRLNFHSPKEGCGKTTAFDVLTTMVPRPLRTENISAPVLFRLVDQHQPTLLLDEVDAYLPQAEELRGLLNAGHKRGACAYRCEGDGNAVRAFNAFAPAALAGIGSLPATLRDQSILIPLVAAEEGQIPARFDQFHTEIENVLARKLTRWAKDNFAALAACDPPLPPGAFNRLADNWRPLLAIAHVAGGDWPVRALAAFTKLTPNFNLGAQNSQLSTLNSQLLLADIRQIFLQSGAQRLFSSAVVNSLRALPDRPWSPSNNGQRPIDEAWVARQLRSFNIAPHNIRIAADRAKGYDLADFTPAFAQFLDGGLAS